MLFCGLHLQFLNRYQLAFESKNDAKARKPFNEIKSSHPAIVPVTFGFFVNDASFSNFPGFRVKTSDEEKEINSFRSWLSHASCFHLRECLLGEKWYVIEIPTSSTDTRNDTSKSRSVSWWMQINTLLSRTESD